MACNKLWTKEEEQYLLRKVKENHGNLQEAFRLAAAHIGRTAASCSFHYYWMRRKGNLEKCFISVSKSSAYVNSKIDRPDAYCIKETTRGKIADTIINFFKNIHLIK